MTRFRALSLAISQFEDMISEVVDTIAKSIRGIHSTNLVPRVIRRHVNDQRKVYVVTNWKARRMVSMVSNRSSINLPSD